MKGRGPDVRLFILGVRVCPFCLRNPLRTCVRQHNADLNSVPLFCSFVILAICVQLFWSSSPLIMEVNEKELLNLERL
jgi:hypothetical protein